MKRRFFLLLATAALGSSVFAAPEPLFQNTQVIISPPDAIPQIDANSFVNAATFIINYTNNVSANNVLPPPFVQLPYEMQSTLNFTNTTVGFMSCNLGFNFQYYAPGNSISNQRRPAASFFNAGVIDSGTIETSNYLADLGEPNIQGTNFIILGNPAAVTTIRATNISNPGFLNMGFESVLSLQGDNIDLSRGTLFVEAGASNRFTTSLSGNFNNFNQGTIFDGAWGIGDPVAQFPLIYGPSLGIIPPDFFGGPQPITPLYDLTFRGEFQVNNPTQMFLTNNPSGYSFDSGEFPSGSGLVDFHQFVWVNPGTNGLAAGDLGVNVYLFPGESIVEFTNLLSTTPNNLYVVDTFGLGNAIDFQLFITGFVGATPTYTPGNFSVLMSQPLGFGTPVLPVPAGSPLFVGPRVNVTNQYAAYDAVISPTSVLLGSAFGQDVTNVPGRVEVSAGNRLDLTLTKISTVNYVKLEATNHFVSSAGAQIISPFFDLNLRSTNALLTISNLVPPSIARPLGSLDLYSARWTNVAPDPFGAIVTNSYSVLMVDANFTASTPPVVRNLALHSTNLLGGPDAISINDAINVSNSFLIDTTSLTVGDANTNHLASPTNGSINVLTFDVLWPDAMPRLQYLINYGTINSLNEIIFGGLQTSIFGNAGSNQPYAAFLNFGSVTNHGSQIGADYFENSGVFQTISGTFDLQYAENAILTNGAIYAPLGNLNLTSDSLFVSNHVLQAGGSLTLNNPYYLDDGSYATASAFSVTNKNFWSVAGLNLAVLPTYSSLLATTITNTSTGQSPIIVNNWFANDVGPVPNGYSGNAAIGHLILDGLDTNSLFAFNGSGAGPSAIYVDCLEFKDQSTNFDGFGNSQQVQIAPGMTIYYAQALRSGVSFAESLSGRYGTLNTNGGRFQWVTNYQCGFFSSTTLTNGGEVYLVNSALRFSKDIDSDNNGINNFYEQFPIPLSDMVTNCPMVPNPVPAQPVVTLTSPAPAPGTVYTAPTNLTLTASVVTGGQPIGVVEFFNGPTLLGSASEPPYSFLWTNVQAGTYTLRAEALWNSGNSSGTPLATISPPLYVTVLGAQSVSNAPAPAPGIAIPPIDTSSGVVSVGKASYQGLFSDTNNGVGPTSAGYFTAATTAQGGVTAVLLVGGRNYTYSGRFIGGVAMGFAHSALGTRLAVQLQMSPDLQQIQGTIASPLGLWSSFLVADRQASDGSASPYASRYTMDVPGAAGVSGDGFGAITLAGATGSLAWSGSLADGSMVTQSSAVSSSGLWPLYAPLYGGKGLIIGWMQFTNGGGAGGDLIWLKPSEATLAFYRAGFTNTVSATAVRYTPPPSGVSALNWASGLGNVVFNNGGLGGPVVNGIYVGPRNGVRDLTLVNRLNMVLNPATGLFSGSALIPQIGVRRPFSGAILGTTNGAGYFLNLSAGQSGDVKLVP